MKILITGGSGQLGSEVCRLSSYDTYGTYLKDYESIGGTKFTQLDITDRKGFLNVVRKIKPDWIVHCAAMTNVDLCEDERDNAWQINVNGTKNAVEASKLVESNLIYISTDYVFDGKKGFYKENDMPNPLSHYAKTKLAGEKLLVKNLDRYIIVRSSVIYSKRKGNFVSWILNSLKNGKVRIVADQTNSPTLNTELSEAILKLIDVDANGVYHAASDERISRYDFAKKIARVFNLDESAIIPIKTEQLNQKAIRPMDSSLDTSKIKRLGIKFSNVSDALKKLKKQMEVS
jgi:dTDP-4-dehydrorhamnose reductase